MVGFNEKFQEIPKIPKNPWILQKSRRSPF
jgi:hypothetical protein